MAKSTSSGRCAENIAHLPAITAAILCLPGSRESEARAQSITDFVRSAIVRDECGSVIARIRVAIFVFELRSVE
jgi:hypothetical protein